MSQKRRYCENTAAVTMGRDGRGRGQEAVDPNNLVGGTVHFPPIFGTWVSYFSSKLSAKKIVF